MTLPFLVGIDTQNYEFSGILSGLQRVSCTAHIGLTDRLGAAGMHLVPFHTRSSELWPRGTRHPSVLQDPVLQLAPVSIEAIDLFLLLDVNLKADYASVYRSIRRRRRPVIAMVHDIIPILHPTKFEEAARREFRTYLQQILHVADHLVVTSEKVRQDLVNLNWHVKGAVHVIPLGSTFRSLAPEVPPDDRISLIYVSTIEPRKGHRVLLQAFDLLLREGLDVDLTFAGRMGWLAGPGTSAIQGHSEFGGRLKWLDAPDDITLQTAIRKCTIGVFPSEDEGFGLFLEEGLALGLKMVARDIPTFRERAQDNLFFHGSTAEDLAAAIAEAHKTPWQPPGRPVRFMSDFHDSLSDLIVATAARGGM